MKTAAIVLAAGRSVRMGAPKMLLPFGNSTVLGTVLDACIASRIDETLVVIPQGDKPLGDLLWGLPVRIVDNPDVDRGMLSSIRCGVEAASDAEVYCIVLGDMPAIRPSIIDGLLAVHRAITIPVCNGKRGHPVLISSAYRDAILTQYDDVGLRGLMDEYRDAVTEVPVDEDGVLLDLDTPEDYARMVGGRDR